MTLAVWKYPVPVTDHFSISLPHDARPLAVMVQRGEPHLWALVNPAQPFGTSERHFRIAGTGHEIVDQIVTHVGSFQMHDGDLVFHLFEVAS